MTNETGDNGISRKGFLKLGWIKQKPQTKEHNNSSQKPFNTTINVEKLTPLEIGAVIKIDDISGIYAVRILEGVIFISNICPYDDAAITWNPKDKSEDLIAKTGRFYCQRCSTIYDRVGEAKFGPGESMLNKMSFLSDNDEVTITNRVDGESISENVIFSVTE